MRSIVILMVPSMSCFAFGPPDWEGCAENAHCPTGNVCLEARCEALCEFQRDCGTGQICDASGVCIGTIEGGNLPRIDVIAGNDPALAGSVRDGLIVQGVTLSEAAFEMQATSGALVALVVRARSDTRAEVIFPPDLRSGTYTLQATNRAGWDQEMVQLLLPELTGQMLLDRLNTQATGTLDAARLPVGSDAGQVSAGDHGHGNLSENTHNHDAAYSAPSHGHTDLAPQLHAHGSYALIVHSHAEQIPSAWANLPLQAGFEASPCCTPQYRITGDWVCLRGTINESTGTTIPDNTQLALLPSGFRPPFPQAFQVHGWSAGGQRVDIFDGGGITLRWNTPAIAAVSVDGVCFSTTP